MRLTICFKELLQPRAWKNLNPPPFFFSVMEPSVDSCSGKPGLFQYLTIITDVTAAKDHVQARVSIYAWAYQLHF